MKDHTSFRIGGPARAMFFPNSAGALGSLCEIMRDYGVIPTIIGNGTNLLVADSPLDIAVVGTTMLKNIRKTGDIEITAESGASLSEIALFAYGQGFSGLEFAHGIPGTLGGAVVMNAGAYGCEMKDVVRATAALGPELEVVETAGEEHGFSYRRSRFSGTGDIVLSSALRLQNSTKESIRERMDELGARRRKSQPLSVPSAGSTFKRPKEGYAALLIDQAGLKGFAIGGAQVSQVHSGFIVNRGAATFSEVMAVIEHVQETVLKRYGIELELEIKIIR